MPLLYRWLHPISIPELYDLYQTHHQGNDGVASVSVFRSEFKKWKPVLQIRQLGQHARCMTCALNANQGHLTLCCQVAMFFWWTIYYYGFNVSSFACFELSSETSLCAHRPEHVRIMTPTSDKAYLQIHPNLKNLWDSICQQTLLTLILFTVEHSYLNWGKYPNKSVMQSYFKP